MTTQEIADRYYSLAQEGKYDIIVQELYSPDIESIEPENSPGLGPKVIKGMEAYKKKGEAWNSSLEEFHGGYCNAPAVAGDYFTLTMGYDATFKGMGRMKEEEVCVFQVKDGKIVSERFFY